MADLVTLHLPCARGTETCVSKELEGLGATALKAGYGVVSCQGPLGLVASINVFSRCASRVLLQIEKWQDVSTEDALMDALMAVRFEDRLDDKGTFSVDAHLRNAAWNNTHFAALRVKDAIVDRFRSLELARPSVDTQRPSIKFVLHWEGPNATLSLDTSGEPLHQRGYRKGIEAIAPMKETLAASMLAIGHADVQRPFLDPVCGTGTLVIEQVWRMLKRAPGRDRHFGFERWRHRAPELDRALASARSQARDEELRTLDVPVHASDWHKDAIDNATQCFERAEVTEFVRLERVDAREANMPGDKAVVVGNLPFGERIGKNPLQLNGFYRTLGERLAGQKNARVLLLSGYERAQELLALERHAHLSRTWPLRSGDLDVTLLRYDISDPDFVKAPRATR